MVDFHKLRVSELYKETKDTVVVSFDIPHNLESIFQFKQGQHLTIRKELDGEDIRRSYSLCTSPIDNQWKVAVKTIPYGKFSNYAFNKLEIGNELLVSPPNGSFFVEVDKSAINNYIAFAAGSGITPILSIIKTHLLSEPKSTFKLFYLNKTVKSIIFKEELEQLKNQFFDRFQIFYFLTQEKRDIPFLNGRFDKEKLAVLTKDFIDVEDTDHAFICGPQDMTFFIKNELQSAGLDKDKIHYELFFKGNSKEESKHIEEILEEKVNGTKVTIIDGGKDFHFVMDDDSDNILDGALSAGADLPFACKGGVCGTCKCKVIEGEIKMKVNYALEDSEIKKNLVLSCQSVPTTEKVTVDFDI